MTVQAVWPWVRAAGAGAVVVTVLAELGYGSLTPALLLPGVIVGSLAGLTAKGVRVLRPRLGTLTTWVAVAGAWGGGAWAFLATTTVCPVEEDLGRCGEGIAGTWAVNVMLAVGVLMLLLEPPRWVWRGVRAATRALRRRWRG